MAIPVKLGSLAPFLCAFASPLQTESINKLVFRAVVPVAATLRKNGSDLVVFCVFLRVFATDTPTIIPFVAEQQN